MSEWTIKDKQQYLYQEIIQAEYDPQLFQQYLESHHGLDLDNWNKCDLIKAVQEFKGNAKQQPDESIPKQQELKEIQQFDRSIPPPPRGSALYQQSFINNTSLYRCLSYLPKPQTSLWKELNKKNNAVNVKIIKFKREQSTSFIFFQTTHIDYQIETSLEKVKWCVDRRYKEFQWLRELLVKSYRNLPVPSIPNKTTIRSFSEQHLEDRRKTLEKFLNQILQSPQLASDPLFEAFLKADREQLLNQKMQYEIQLNSRVKSNQFWSLFTEQMLQPKKATVGIEQLQQFTQNAQIYYRMSQKAKETDNCLTLAEKSYTELDNCVLETHSSQKNMKNSSVYALIHQYIVSIKKWITQSKQILNSYIKQVYEYQGKMMEEYAREIQRIRQFNYHFNTKFKDIFKIYEDGEIPVLQSASNNANYLRSYQKEKQEYKISLSRLLLEIQRHNNESLVYRGKQWLDGLRLYMDGLRENMMDGADLLTKAISASQGKSLLEVEIIK